jgi:signal transduction histidine kinase
VTGPADRGRPSGPEPEGRQWTLRQRVTALCLLAAAVLTFLAAGATTTAVANRGQLDRLLDQIGPMRTGSTALATALNDQDTAVRSYVLNGNPSDLTRYRDALDAEQTQTSAIVANPSAGPEIQARLGAVTATAARWRTEVAEPAIAARTGGDRTTAEAVLDDPARTQFASVRSAVTGMLNSVQVVRDEAVSSIRDTSTTLMFVLVVAVILVIASGVALVLALQRAIVGPLTDLAAQVRSVARGHYDSVISTTGPPEFERLASDVDSMRQQIASDLAEVEAARRQIEQANVQLEQQAAELVRSNRDLEQFAYVASHDLQEPLRKVASFCQLLQRRYQGQLDERADQYIAFAVNGAQRMQRLINDLLAFSRIGRVTTGFTAVDLNRVVATEVAQLEVDDEPGRPEVTWANLPVVRGEEALLSTLVANLIGNAVKFHRPGEPARVHISARRDGDQWEIGCEDRGIGIEGEFVEKVFVIFQRLHAREAYPGTGIGLAIAKKIVEYHGGVIWVDTAYTGGTAIRFTLPVGGAGGSTDGHTGTSMVADGPARTPERPQPDSDRTAVDAASPRTKEPAA